MYIERYEFPRYRPSRRDEVGQVSRTSKFTSEPIPAHFNKFSLGILVGIR